MKVKDRQISSYLNASSLTPVTSMPLAVETPHTLFNALQATTSELDIQVCMLEEVIYRRNSVVMHMRVLKEHQGLGT